MSENFLKKIREERAMSQVELAEKVGVQKQTIWGWENNKFGLTKDNLKKVAEVLGVNTNYILNGKKETFDGKSKERLSRALSLAHVFFVEQKIEEDQVTELATEIYDLLTTIDGANNAEKENLLRSLKLKYLHGLAAHCIINLEQK